MSTERAGRDRREGALAENKDDPLALLLMGPAGPCGADIRIITAGSETLATKLCATALLCRVSIRESRAGNAEYGKEPALRPYVLRPAPG